MSVRIVTAGENGRMLGWYPLPKGHRQPPVLRRLFEGDYPVNSQAGAL